MRYLNTVLDFLSSNQTFDIPQFKQFGRILVDFKYLYSKLKAHVKL